MGRVLIVTIAAASIALVATLEPAPAVAEMLERSFEFKIGEWHALDTDTSPITLHRIRLDRKDARFSKSTLSRPYNQKFIDTIAVQLEYTNT
jgi:hypothetical protein